MAYVRGYDCVISVAGKQICYVKDVTVNKNTTSGDAKTRCDSGWDRPVQSGRGWSVDFDLVYNTSDSGYPELVSAWMSGTSVAVVLTRPGERNAGYAFVADLTESQPLEDVVNISVSLSGQGALTLW